MFVKNSPLRRFFFVAIVVLSVALFNLSCKEDEKVHLSNEHRSILKNAEYKIRYERIDSGKVDTLTFKRDTHYVDFVRHYPKDYEYGEVEYSEVTSSSEEMYMFITKEQSGHIEVVFIDQSLSTDLSTRDSANGMKLNGKIFDKVMVYDDRGRRIWLSSPYGIIKAELDSGEVYERIF